MRDHDVLVSAVRRWEDEDEDEDGRWISASVGRMYIFLTTENNLLPQSVSQSVSQSVRKDWDIG